ncbi:MAG: efflux RND transporter permease subunit [Proteobacteria bacterium]|nr:efflux RND transporter permease subunit [Cystobacterineae bacterium]MCL2258977.1 efflux RND transporter permease subunit [Cystobacterineae bacterium]MCL2314663.1 efflux RND transporter permease subunit [Pseudomonadota bacterium]
MTLSDLSIKRPVFTVMMSMSLIVLGVLGLSRLGTDLFPDLSIPVVTVQTIYRGAGPSEIETQVMKPIEDAIAGISGVDSLHSYSRENAGIIVAQFAFNKNVEEAVQDVRDKVANIAHILPSDMDPARVSRVDLGAIPVITYALSSNLKSTALREAIRDQLEPVLAQLEGVAEIRITGGDKREIRVDLDLEKVKQLHMSPIQVAQMIGAENLDLPAGRLYLGPEELTVRSLGQFSTVDEIRKLPIAKSQTGAQVRLEEIAAVTDGAEDKRTFARLDGEDTILVDVVKQAGSNTVAVTKLVKEKMGLMPRLIGNDFRSVLVFDQSRLIKENTNEVWIALFFGGGMAILIILIFLLDIRGTIISALALPTSVIGTFFFMYTLGYSINQMTLLALSLAIGLLIDDAVVVREAITHRLDKGEHPIAAASHGTHDVMLAVMATTLSLVSVFIPVAFMPGMVGQFFKQFGVTIAVAVFISLFISFTLDPSLSSRFAKQRDFQTSRKENAVLRFLRSLFELNEKLYSKALHWSLNHKAITVMAVTAFVFASGYVSLKGSGFEFMPQQDNGQVGIDLKLPASASLEETGKRVAEVEALLANREKYPEILNVYSIIGQNSDVNRARIRVILTDKQYRKKSNTDFKAEFRNLLVPILPATEVAFLDPPPIEGLGGDFFPIMVRLIGPDLQKVGKIAEEVSAYMGTIGAAEIRIESNPPKPELQLRPNRQQLQDMNVPVSSVAMQMRLAMDGQIVGKLRQGKEEPDIVVRLMEKDRATPEQVERIDIFTPYGAVPIKNLAEIELNDGPSLIERHNRERQIALNATVQPGAALGDIAQKLREYFQEHPLPPGYNVIYDGQMKTLDEQMSAFSVALILAILFIYIVLASQFESFKHPFTILLSVPLAIVGALITLWFSGNYVSMAAMIGFILLIGLVTKNAILLIDGALQNMRAGDDIYTSMLKAGPRRLRPILMTSAAMAIGMVPTAIGRGLGSEFRSPMALSVIGGVIMSTFLTLFVVPIAFIVFEEVEAKLRKWFGLKPPSHVLVLLPSEEEAAKLAYAQTTIMQTLQNLEAPSEQTKKEGQPKEERSIEHA